MSANGYKRILSEVPDYVRFPPLSGHPASNVRLAYKSERNFPTPITAANDPKRTKDQVFTKYTALHTGLPSYLRSAFLALVQKAFSTPHDTLIFNLRKLAETTIHADALENVLFRLEPETHAQTELIEKLTAVLAVAKEFPRV